MAKIVEAPDESRQSTAFLVVSVTARLFFLYLLSPFLLMVLLKLTYGTIDALDRMPVARSVVEFIYRPYRWFLEAWPALAEGFRIVAEWIESW